MSSIETDCKTYQGNFDNDHHMECNSLFENKRFQLEASCLSVRTELAILERRMFSSRNGLCKSTTGSDPISEMAVELVSAIREFEKLLHLQFRNRSSSEYYFVL